jgi:hypothetical protein
MTKIEYVESEAKIPASVTRAAKMVADCRAYAAKSPSGNLADFRAFASAIFGPVLVESGVDAATAKLVCDLAGPIAGTYSRYQEAKRVGFLGEILEPTTYRVGKAPAARKPKASTK